jgi:hypothetical protein
MPFADRARRIGKSMTVCIAAQCFPQKCLVLASDMMVTTVDMSSDAASVKSRGIGKKWMVLFAGNDISSVDPIVTEVREQCRLSTYKDTIPEVRDAFIKAFQTQLRLKSENEVLKPIGYSLEEFKKSGLSQLGPENFSRFLYQMQQQSIDVEFLVAGFDKDAHIFTVTSPGKVSDFSPVGFWAIGSGQTNALGSFFNCQGALFASDISTIIYRVCEAKFNAEGATGVGKKTIMTILRDDGERHSILKEVDSMRPLWEKTRVITIASEAKSKAEELWNIARGEFDKKKAGAATPLGNVQSEFQK